MQHILECFLLPEPCRPNELVVFNLYVRVYVLQWHRKIAIAIYYVGLVETIKRYPKINVGTV